MDEHRIEELLRGADAAAETPRDMPAELPGEIRRLAQRRRHARAIRRTAIVVIGLAALAGSVLYTLPTRPGGDGRPKVVSHLDDAAMQAEIRRLDIEVETRMAIVDHMLRIERRQKRLSSLLRQLDRPDPREQLHAQVERAAFILISQADRLDREEKSPHEAAEYYRRIVKLFPETRWARVAADRLQEIGTSDQGELL